MTGDKRGANYTEIAKKPTESKTKTKTLHEFKTQ